MSNADPIAAIAKGMSEEQARDEEHTALVEQLKQSHLDSITNQLDESIRMIAELLAVSCEVAGQKVAERMKRGRDTK